MRTTADKLNRLINTKEGIRQEINRAYETEEISNSDTFNSYIQKLEEHPFYIMRFIERTAVLQMVMIEDMYLYLKYKGE